MKPTNFEEANCTFGAPSDMEESQVSSIGAFVGIQDGGSCDGIQITITAWKPSEAELAALVHGNPIFITFMGLGLPPHLVTASFGDALSAT